MIEAIEKINISNKVYEKMLNMIVEGNWKQGQMIPSENELCESFSVSRNTIRQSIHRLSALGILNSVQGKGTFVSKIDAGPYLNMLLPTVFLGDKDSTSVLSFMKAIQVESVRIVCNVASDESILKLGDFIEKMKSAEDYSKFFDYDIAYHHYLARLTENSLFTKSMEIAAELLRVYLQDIVALHGSHKSIEQHEICYQALIDRDLDKAVETMGKHYDMLMERLTNLLKAKNNRTSDIAH